VPEIADTRVEELIPRLVEWPDGVLSERDLRELGPAGQLLRRWGGIVEIKHRTTIACASCDGDHDVDLEFDPALGTWSYYCSSGGVIPAEAEELLAFRFEPGWLRARLAAGLRIARPRDREIVPGVLWDLGDAALGDRPWSAFLARAVGLHLDAIHDALRTGGGKLRGLVLVSSPVVPSSIPLPYRHQFVALADCLSAAGGELGVSDAAILAALGADKTKRPPGSKGRPNLKGPVLDLYRKREAAGETAAMVGDEAQAIHERLLRERPGSQPPAVGTIARHIRQPHRAWRERSPESTK
jgi:hypothetical protein